MKNDGEWQFLELYIALQLVLILFKIMGLSLSWFWILSPTWLIILGVIVLVSFALYVGEKVGDFILRLFKRGRSNTDEE